MACVRRRPDAGRTTGAARVPSRVLARVPARDRPTPAPAPAPAAAAGPGARPAGLRARVRARGAAGRAAAAGGDAGPTKAELAAQNLQRVGVSMQKLGWVSFWIQLAMALVSVTILVFSTAFSGQGGPPVTITLTIFGAVSLLFSTFWTFWYTRLSRKLRSAATGDAGSAPSVQAVDKRLGLGSLANLSGLGVTLLGLEANVGILVAKTLTNATANPFLAGGAGSWNPVLALDVFLIQAALNTCIGHFVAAITNMWLRRVLRG